MKRRAPTIWAAVVALAVLGLAHRESKLQKQREREAAASQESATPVEEESEKAEDEDDPSLVELAAMPKPTTGPVPASAQFHMMPDGTPVPALSPSTPDKIKLGVVLFRYKGAQGSSDSTRSRDAAESLAKEAAKIAQEDFSAAVKKGDHGSSENIGWMKQRVLERAVEYAVFSLDKGEISKEPIDTPRGFWVAKRLR